MNVLHAIRAGLALTLIAINTVLLCIPLYLLTLVKLALRSPRAQVTLSRALVAIAETWMSINNAIITVISLTPVTLEGAEGLSKKDWYLVTANHQSWADILVLQRVFNRRIPMLKFFLKQDLIKVPVLGHAWWALDFPFMQRHSRAELEKNPELRHQDLEATRRACAKFAHFPTSVMNFFEGTRFDQAKHDQQQSPYRHLLKPKAGGTAFALHAMGGKLGTLLDVTILYPRNRPRTLTAFLGGAMSKVEVIVVQRPIPAWAAQGDYDGDAEFRARFQAWISDMWAEKDALIEARQNRSA
ncbi:acyltransferase [Isoalcanivorax beigongshangi]|uniref:Acyltransferase n=1 Tax=Isoalcanivorax beigongshangi TaxID=3238810 RepID=A0ABV4AKI9_9GAMM